MLNKDFGGWEKLNYSEFLRFNAALLGMCVNPCKNMNEYCSQNCLFHNDFISKLLTYHRFVEILHRFSFMPYSMTAPPHLTNLNMKGQPEYFGDNV